MFNANIMGLGDHHGYMSPLLKTKQNTFSIFHFPIIYPYMLEKFYLFSKKGCQKKGLTQLFHDWHNFSPYRKI